MDIYTKIKRQNGETFAKEIRRFDSGIFDIENLAEIVRFAGRDAKKILSFLESLKSTHNEVKKTTKNPFELLLSVGYDAFVADTLQKQNLIQKYFKKEEELCTFRDPNRFENNYIIHAVKCGANKLNRADFVGKEAREDEYATSVISIQISKKDGFISIKNRYNHTVNNPDNTFHSNPDEIVEGLSEALSKHFGVEINPKKKLPNGYVFFDNRIYKYHQKKDNAFFGENFVLFDGKVHFFDKDYQIVADRFLIDLKQKRVLSIMSDVLGVTKNDSWANTLLPILNAELEGKHISHRRLGARQFIFADKKMTLALENGRIKSILSRCVKSLSSFHSEKEDVIKSLYFKELEWAGKNTFTGFEKLKSIVAPKLKKIGTHSVYACELLKKCDMPSLEMVGLGSFSHLLGLRYLRLTSLKQAGAHTFSDLVGLENILLPNIQQVGDDSFQYLEDLKFFYAPKLKTAGDRCFCGLDNVEKIILPCDLCFGYGCFEDDFLNKSIKPIFCLTHAEGQGKNNQTIKYHFNQDKGGLCHE